MLIGVCVCVILTAPPATTFDTPQTVTIEEGTSMAETASLLKERHIVYSRTLVHVLAVLRGADTSVKAGEYLFTQPLGVWETVSRLAEGMYGFEPVRVRLQEGSTRRQMAQVLTESLLDFDTERFLQVTHDKEGYLFPDTYFFSPNMKAEDIAVYLEEIFFQKMKRLEPLRALSGHSLNEIVTMASIIEREAHRESDQKLIAGVLWNRLAIGMALQVDAPFFFLLGKTSDELTLEDLKTDSPYNTYIYPGLPPTPIANPSLSALEAALDPTPSEYLFYLSDDDGVTHYAKDFEEHKRNKELYLQ